MVPPMHVMIGKVSSQGLVLAQGRPVEMRAGDPGRAEPA